jgi:hypothetical protein
MLNAYRFCVIGPVAGVISDIGFINGLVAIAAAIVENEVSRYIGRAVLEPGSRA